MLDDLGKISIFNINTPIGMNVGLIMTPPITSFMTETYGWESCFYMVGSLTCIWFALWTYLVYNSPEEHPRISEAVKYFVMMLRYSKVQSF